VVSHQDLQRGAETYKRIKLLQWAFVPVALALVVGLGFGLRAFIVRGGSVRLPFTSQPTELDAQLRDRSTVLVAGEVPWSVRRGETPLTSLSQHPTIARALDGTDEAAALAAYRSAHLDGLLVQTSAPVGAAGSALRALSSMRPAERFGAVYLDDAAAVYEPREPLTIDPADARRLITVARFILQGAVAPPERAFPESLRRTRPVEVALFVRDGREAILWRSTRGGSVARAFLDVCFAVLDRWTSRQTERYGRLRDALRTLTITVAVFYDKGVLGSRSPEFLRRAADPRVWAVGYERLAAWEYALPPSPWKPAMDPSDALRSLTRERGVPPPGHLRQELTLYRFRALQLVEQAAAGDVTIFDPR
jgi:hypothetical protein